MLINQAMFRVNGNTGYVLKPEFLRPDANNASQVNFNPNDKKTWPTKCRTVFNVEVSGFFITMNHGTKPERNISGIPIENGYGLNSDFVPCYERSLYGI